jgi:TonB family protein
VKKIIYILSLSFLSGIAVKAQEVKKVNYTPPGASYWEQYYVLKVDKNMKHGSYKRLNSRGSVLCTGFYKNGKEDSTWTYFIPDTKTVKSKGNFKNGKETGVWQYFNENEKLVKHFNVENGSFITFEPVNGFQDEYIIKSKDGFKKAILSRPPMLIEPKIPNDLGPIDPIDYPRQAMINGIEGTVYISCFINKDGVPTDISLEKGIGHGCDEEALRFAKEALPKFPFLPGLLNNEVVEAKYIYQIPFIIRLGR